jgi:hypothetical protein
MIHIVWVFTYGFTLFRDEPLRPFLQYLRSTEFQTLMYNLIDSLADQEHVNPTRTL